MDVKHKRMRLGLALIVLLAFAAVPSMGDQKVNLFNPFTLQSKSVVAASSSPSVALDDLLLLASGATGSRLTDEDPRPSITLRGQEIRIPTRPDIRSSFSRFPPFDASIW